MFPSRPQAQTGARIVGWLGIVLGAAQLLSPRAVSRAAGVPGDARATRAIGAREIATGVALLHSERPQTWMWARVAGDALDAVLLARTLRREGATAPRAALVALGALALLDVALARRLSQPAPVARVDYRARSGFPLPSDEMRGMARGDFAAPADMRVPAALRPWSDPPGAAVPVARDARV